MKNDNIFTRNYDSKPIVCFLLALIALILGILEAFDYFNTKAIVNSNLEEISFVEGIIVKAKKSKSNIHIEIENNNMSYFIHSDYLNDYEINAGANAKIYYENSNPMRGNSRIAQLEINGNVIFSLSQYKEKTNIGFNLAIFIIGANVGLILIILGIVFIIKNKKMKENNDFLSDNEIEIIIKSLKNPKKDKALNSNIKKEDLLFKKNNQLYTNIELIENEEIGELFFEALGDLASENELSIVYDEAQINDSSIFVVYQINNRKAIIYLFIDEDKKKYIINRETLYFEDGKKVNEVEIDKFISKIKEYNLLNEDIFVIE